MLVPSGSSSAAAWVAPQAVYLGRMLDVAPCTALIRTAHKRPGTGLTSLTVAAFFCLAVFFALRHHPATSDRADAGARQRGDDAGPRDRYDRSHQRAAYRAHLASDRADQQSRHGMAGNAELYSRWRSRWAAAPRFQ
jgi:hypothetical protein